jgi:hypothetical protein
MPVHNLPAFRAEGARTPDPASAGAWRPLDIADLKTIAEDLSIRESPKERKAVPDTWAQLITFGQALTDPNHPRYERVRGEWRALLALLALGDVHRTLYSIEVKAVGLEASVEAGDFVDTLRRLPPRNQIFDGVDLSKRVWNLLLTDKVGKLVNVLTNAPVQSAQLFGFLSPATLLAAGRSVSLLRHESIPFIDRGLIDPISVKDRVNKAHFKVIAQFLTEDEGLLLPAVRQAFQAVGKSEDWRQQAARLRDEFEDFRLACLEASAGSDIKLYPGDRARRNWPESECFRRLDATFVPDPDAVVSDVFLDLPARRIAPMKGVILDDLGVAKTLGRPAHDLKVFGSRSLQDLQDEAVRAEVIDRALAADVLILRPDDLFNAEAVRLESTEIVAHPGDLTQWVLPLSPAALFLVDPSEVAERVSIIVSNDPRLGDTATVRLKVPLGAGRDHIVQKVYAQSPPPNEPGYGRWVREGGIDEYNLPSRFAVWPNFESPDWGHNCLFFLANPRDDLVPLTGLSSQMIAEEVKSAKDPGERRAALHRWAKGCHEHLVNALPARAEPIKSSDEHTPWLERLRFSDRADDVSEWQKLRRLEAVAVAWPETPSRRRYAGLVMVRRPPPSGNDQGQAVVAIDFGTTGTIVMLRETGGYAGAVFHDRVHFPSRPKGYSQEQLKAQVTEAFEGFFPITDRQAPITTVVRKREGVADADGYGPEQIGFAHTIYFEDAQVRAFENARSNSLFFGLKWGAGRRPLARRFLRQVILMTAAELRARGFDPVRAKWRFSYPEAFSSLDLSQFQQNAAGRALRDVFGGSPEAPSVTPEYFTEGAAALAHFRSGAYTPGDSTLVLDIGGGTTDVAIWDDSRLLWRNSFKIAGQAFMTNLIRNNPEFIRAVMGDTGEIRNIIGYLQENVDGSPDFQDRKLGVVEILLASKQFQANFSQRFADTMDEGVALALRASSTVALSGVLWYVGRTFRMMIQKDGVLAGRLGACVVALAGRGAQIYRSYHSASAVDDSYLAHMASIVLTAAGVGSSSLRGDQIIFTREAKKEVVLGMLVNSDPGDNGGGITRAKPKTKRLPLLFGLSVEATGGVEMQLGADTDLLEAHNALPQGAQDMVLKVDLTAELDAFFLALRQCSGLSIALKPAAQAQLAQRVQYALRQQLQSVAQGQSAPDTQAVEPPFIIAVREIVNWLAKPLAERDTLVDVRLLGG